MKRELRVAPVRASHNPRSTMLERERERAKRRTKKNKKLTLQNSIRLWVAKIENEITRRDIEEVCIIDAADLKALEKLGLSLLAHKQI